MMDDSDLSRDLDVVSEVARKHGLSELVVERNFSLIIKEELSSRGLYCLSRYLFEQHHYAALKDLLKLGRLRMINDPDFTSEFTRATNLAEDMESAPRVAVVVMAVHEVMDPGLRITWIG